jgi:uncharacterized membrane protein
MKVLRIGFVLFFLFAGVYHFVNPALYLGLIPDYIPYPELVNYLSGSVEILIALLAIPNKTRKIAGYGGILLMLAFVPAHIYFIQIGSCIPSGLCVPEWLAYVRLFVVHPLLIGWAWSVKTDYLRKEWFAE